MRVSISVSAYSWPGGPGQIGPGLDRTVRAADDAGVDTIWLPDHLIQVDPRSAPDADMLEVFTTLGYIAARTERVRLGALVTPVSYRPPAITIKAVTSLDVLSAGRAWFGVGAGYSEDEAARMGLPLPPTKQRFERLSETLELARQMWAGDRSAFAGEHYQLTEPLHSPPSVQRPHPPVLIGGSGEKKTLRLVAQYADACNLQDYPDGGASIRHKLDVLARHCADVGRSYADIDRTAGTSFAAGGSTSDFAARCETLAGYGITHLILFPDGGWNAETLAPLPDVVAAAEKIGG